MRTVHTHAKGLRGSRRGGRLCGRHYGGVFVGLVCVVLEGECPISLKPNETLVWSLVGDPATSVEALQGGSDASDFAGRNKNFPGGEQRRRGAGPTVHSTQPPA